MRGESVSRRELEIEREGGDRRERENWEGEFVSSEERNLHREGILSLFF